MAPEHDGNVSAGVGGAVTALLKADTVGEVIIQAAPAPAKKPKRPASRREQGQSWASPLPTWMRSSTAYWLKHDFGRGGRPAPGTKLILELSQGFGIPTAATCAKVLPYDGRWLSSSFPVRLMRPNYEPTTVDWMLSVLPARNGATLLLATYDLVGCKLADPQDRTGANVASSDLTGTHATGLGTDDVETVTLRARRLQLVETGGTR